MKEQKELKAEIAELKKTHSDVYEFSIPLASGEITLLLKKPGRIERKLIADMSQTTDEERAVQAGLNALRIGGDEVSEIFEASKTDYDVFVATKELLIDFMQVRKGVIKKN